MSLPVVLRPAARFETDEIRGSLEERQNGLGLAFLDRLKETLSEIGEFPEVHDAIWRNVRAVPLHQFPYAVYYRLHSERIEVVALLHTIRDVTRRTLR